jgi:hypothetical protein
LQALQLYGGDYVYLLKEKVFDNSFKTFRVLIIGNVMPALLSMTTAEIAHGPTTSDSEKTQLKEYT